MKSVAASIAVVGMLVAHGIAFGQGDAGAPPGSRSYGSTWCVFVSGSYETFLSELAKLIDMGGEVQGYEKEGGKYSALVCKRGRPN